VTFTPRTSVPSVVSQPLQVAQTEYLRDYPRNPPLKERLGK
jgi:hypothetical protein